MERWKDLNSRHCEELLLTIFVCEEKAVLTFDVLGGDVRAGELATSCGDVSDDR